MKKIIFTILILIFTFSNINITNAAFDKSKLDNLGNSTTSQTIMSKGGVNTNTNALDLTSKIINLILGLFGVIALIFIIKAGIDWIKSKGDSTIIKKSREVITSGIIGLIIIATSYAASNFVINQIIDTTGSRGSTEMASSCETTGGFWYQVCGESSPSCHEFEMRPDDFDCDQNKCISNGYSWINNDCSY